uniref:Uncharacterized protein n=2 Tax=Cereibacter TaxID=1653176 RepID=A4WWL4_CERS5
MIAAEDPLQDSVTSAARVPTDVRLIGSVRVMTCEASPIGPQPPPAAGVMLHLSRDPRRPFASNVVLLVDEAGDAVAEIPSLPVRVLAALLDNGCQSLALVEKSGPRLSVGIHLAAPF